MHIHRLGGTRNDKIATISSSKLEDADYHFVAASRIGFRLGFRVVALDPNFPVKLLLITDPLHGLISMVGGSTNHLLKACCCSCFMDGIVSLHCCIQQKLFRLYNIWTPWQKERLSPIDVCRDPCFQGENSSFSTFGSITDVCTDVCYDLLAELLKREEAENMKPDGELDLFMKFFFNLLNILI